MEHPWMVCGVSVALDEGQEPGLKVLSVEAVRGFDGATSESRAKAYMLFTTGGNNVMTIDANNLKHRGII